MSAPLSFKTLNKIPIITIPIENLIPRQNLDLMVVPLFRSKREVESVAMAAAKENTINEFGISRKWITAQYLKIISEALKSGKLGVMRQALDSL